MTEREYTKEEKLKVIQHYCKTDLRFLCKDMLGMDKWDDNLHSDMEKFMKESGRYKMVLIPRGHLKTSIITVGWTIQQILKNPNIRILINNAVWDNARTILYQISDLLIDKSDLHEFFGPFKGKGRWTRDEIEVSQKNKSVGKEPTVSTGGVESAKVGMHYDIIINDDIVIRDNVTTKEQIEKVINFHRDCFALLDPGGILINIGTRWALGDLYGHILNTDMNSLNGHVFTEDEDKLEWRKYANR